MSSAVPSSYGLDFITFKANFMMTEPWEHPCGTALGVALKRSPQRHSVHRTLKRVKTQLRVAKNRFRNDLKDIHDIYSKVYKVLKGQYHMSWLPKDQLKWYYRDLWCQMKDKKAEYALPRLYDGLQRFAVTFHSLQGFRLKSNINVEYTINRRNEIVNGMQNEVFRMLCEVETAILNLGFKLPNYHKTVMVTESPDWATEGDLTLMLIQDWGVLRLYKVFLHDWTSAFRNATAKGLGTCDSNTLSPFVYRARKKNLKKQLQHGNKIRNKNIHTKNSTLLRGYNHGNGSPSQVSLRPRGEWNYPRKKSLRKKRIKNQA